MERRQNDSRTDNEAQAGGGRLSGVRILIAEDESLIAMELSALFEEMGAEVVGPCATLDRALATAEEEPLSAAVLDLMLGRDSIAPLARLLARRKVPFFFYSGQSSNDPIRMEWPESVHVAKPAQSRCLIDTVVRLLPGAC
jgi:DNA-binding response OmpR family regulator